MGAEKMAGITEKTTVTETGLVKIGRSGTKTHIAEVTYEITNPGTPRQRKIPVAVRPICGTAENRCGVHGRARLGVTVVGLAGGNRPTCKLCDERLPR
jgi:hypothetical protein